jgi:hypothetical protein
MKTFLVSTSLALFASSAVASDPFATQMVAYAQGTNPAAGFVNPTAALGEPARMTGSVAFPSAVTPFNPPYLTSQIVSIGEGGSLTLGFDHPVTNDPLNPFGFDLLVFGNAFYHDPTFSGVAAGVVSAGGGIVEVSDNLDTWIVVPGTAAESVFPTLGYSDLTNPYAESPGNVLSDFTRPVNPSFNAFGMNFAQIVAAYDGAGGGNGIDIGPTGLNSIRYIRITNPVGSGVTVEIDGVSDVPAPGTAALLCAWGGCAALSGRRRAVR